MQAHPRARALAALACLAVAPTAFAHEPLEPHPGFDRQAAFVQAEVGSSHSGDRLAFEGGAAWLALRPLDGRAWLLNWEGLASVRGGWLANQHPFLGYVGGRVRGHVEAGRRFQPGSDWSAYVGARFTGDAAVLVHPGLSLAQLDTVNNSEGFGGVTVDGALRVGGGASYLAGTTSMLFTLFVAEAVRAPRLVQKGAALTGVGASARLDLGTHTTVLFDLFAGLAPTATDTALQVTDQLTRVEGALAVRQHLGDTVWLSLGLALGRDTHRVTWTETSTRYDITNAPDFTAALAFGYDFGRSP